MRLESQTLEAGGLIVGMVEAGGHWVEVESRGAEADGWSRAQAIEDKADDVPHDAPFQNHSQSS
eukprot:5666820-Pyramimonas_sp.AAC.1